jgi:probable rRNA maturation factor
MIVNRQRNVRVSVAGLERFCTRACRVLRLPEDSMTVCLVTAARMKRWNHAYRGRNRPTDVLSFSAQASSGDKWPLRSSRNGRKGASVEPANEYIGDIAIAPAVARENARQLGRTFDNEMRILILHGMLHLMGYDHETDNGQMERRERKMRRALGLA